MLRSTTLALGLLLFSRVDAAQMIVPSSMPNTAAPLPSDFVGLSIEEPHFTEWAGSAIGQPNTFVLKALDRLCKLTNTHLPIRVGGTPEDLILLDSNQKALINATFPAGTTAQPYPAATAATISPSFYGLSANFPSDTLFTWGINFRSLDITETVKQAAAVVKSFASKKGKGVVLERIEIGNEPDYFANARVGGTLNSTYWNAATYVKTWSDYANKVVTSVKLGSAHLQVGAFANSPSPYDQWWLPGILSGGVLGTKAVQQATNVWSQHVYFGVFLGLGNPANPQPGTIANRAFIRSNTVRLGEQAAIAARSGLSYIIGETNTAANHGVYGLSDAAESVIWAVDYSLQLATIGIKRAHFHNGLGYAYNVLQPVPIESGPAQNSQPAIQALYTGLYIVNEVIGSSHNAKVVELLTTTSNTAGYAIYESSKLKRVVLINFDPYIAGGAARTSEVITLSGLPSSGKVKRFYTPYTTSTTGLTWGGVDLTNINATASSMKTTRYQGNSITVNAAEVAVLYF